MKRVAVLVFNDFTHDSRVLREGISLQEGGYQVQIVALQSGDLPIHEIKHGLPVHRLKLKTRSLPKSIYWQIFKWLELFILIAKHYRKVDYFHVCDVLPLPMAVWTKKLFNKRIKIIYDAHELEFQKNTSSKRYGQLIAWLEAKHIHQADARITVTRLISKVYADHYQIPEPHTIYNFPYFQKPSHKDHFRKKFGIRANQRILLYQGTIAPNRGCESLVEAFKEMPEDYVLVFLGYGPLWNTIWDRSKDQANIFMHEAVDMNVLLEYTASADIGIYSVINSNPSHDYSLGNKVFEYIMAGLPIISTDLKGVRDFLPEDFTIFIEKLEAQAIKNAIQQLDQKPADQLEQAIQQFAQTANWNEEQKKLLNIYAHA